MKVASLFLSFPLTFGRVGWWSPLSKEATLFSFPKDNRAYSCTLKDRAGTALPSGSSPTSHFPLLDQGRCTATKTWNFLFFLPGPVFLCTSMLTCSFFGCFFWGGDWGFWSLGGFFWPGIYFHLHMLPSHHLDFNLTVISSERTSQDIVSSTAPSAAAPRHSPFHRPLSLSSDVSLSQPSYLSVCSLVCCPSLHCRGSSWRAAAFFSQEHVP